MHAAKFDEVFLKELGHVAGRRATTLRESVPEGFGLPDFQANLIDPGQQSDELRALIAEMTSDEQNALWTSAEGETCRPGLVGIAFSGGGIRSSTFNLGVLQVLHKVGIFRCADYMSTVSGGGYLGTYVSTFFSDDERQDDKKPPYFPFEHIPGKRETDEMRHLRNHANYLAPEGFRSLLALPIVLARGLLINFLVLLPYLLGFALLLSMLLSPQALDAERLSYGGIWETGYRLLPPYFPATLGLLLFMAVTLCLYPVGQFWVRLRHTSKKYRYLARMVYLKSMAGVLLVALVVFFVELQPLALNLMRHPYPVAIGGFVSVSVLGNVFSDRLLDLLGGFLGKFGLFLLGLLGFFSVWVIFLMLARYLVEHGSGEPWVFGPVEMAYIGIGTALFLYTLSFLDINHTSIHNFYRDRLSEAFVHGEKVPLLTALKTDRSPYHLINAAINVEQATEAYRNGRKSSFFLMSKEYCGSFRTGYCKTSSWPNGGENLDAGTAMAISGAAVAPNMGKFTSSVLTFILTVLNLRLNYWLPNPARVAAGEFLPLWYRRIFGINKVGPRYLLREMVGKLKVTTRFVNLSDGGHIENLGVYELLKRNCRLIVAGDAEADSGLAFQGLSDLIRMAQIDFGVHVVMDGLDEIRDGTQRYARGRIYYSGGRVGQLLYLKSNLGGDYNLKDTLEKEQYRTSSERDDDFLYDDNTYLAHYRHISPDFPHESTADQFFDEFQFESYRALGYQVAAAALLR